MTKRCAYFWYGSNDMGDIFVIAYRIKIEFYRNYFADERMKKYDVSELRFRTCPENTITFIWLIFSGRSTHPMKNYVTHTRLAYICCTTNTSLLFDGKSYSEYFCCMYTSVDMYTHSYYERCFDDTITLIQRDTIRRVRKLILGVVWSARRA